MYLLLESGRGEMAWSQESWADQGVQTILQRRGSSAASNVSQ